MRPTGLVDPQIEIRPAGHQVDDVMNEIKRCVALDERVLITTLTKRMAEDLTDFLDEHGIRVRYVHSDIDTVERVEIIRDLRRGEFDVLVGINLLREGLDMPEVSLVAIFDADKEGFLRSEQALIQTIGRAARHINGKAILYADKVTGSMQRAMDETDRRRAKQEAHNKANNLVPQGIVKAIPDVLEGAMSSARGKRKQQRAVAEQKMQYEMGGEVHSLSPAQLAKRLKTMEDKMYEHARNLEFEEASVVRDALEALKHGEFAGG